MCLNGRLHARTEPSQNLLIWFRETKSDASITKKIKDKVEKVYYYDAKV